MDASQTDLSDETLHKIRGHEDCAIDLARLTLEARQVGHNRVSKLIIDWAELLDAAFDKLLRNKDLTPKEGTLGYGLKTMTVSELSSLAFNGTKIIFEVFADDLAEHIQGELAAAETSRTAEPKERPSPEELARYVETLLCGAWDRLEASRAAEVKSFNTGGGQAVDIEGSEDSE